MMLQYRQSSDNKNKSYQAWIPFVKLPFELSHSPGVANATGTVTTKPNEIKTNKAVKAVIISIFRNFYIDDQN
jgi:hypothetical protein